MDPPKKFGSSMVIMSMRLEQKGSRFRTKTSFQPGKSFSRSAVVFVMKETYSMYTMLHTICVVALFPVRKTFGILECGFFLVDSNYSAES